VKLGAISEFFSLKDLRNALVGAFVVLGGISLAALTFFAHRFDQPRLAGLAAAISLVFVLIILIFIVPPLARNASKEASQMNLPFEFTLGGAIMLGLLAIVGFSAWNTGNNLLFLVLAFLVAAMVIGFLAGGTMLKKLDVKMRFPETIFAGEVTPILVSLNNRKRLFPVFSVVVDVRGSEREESVAAADLRRLLPVRLAKRLSKPPIIRRTLDYFVHIPRGQVMEAKSQHIFPERGRFLIKDFEISTKFPFGFFRHRRRLPARETELVVFPRVERAELDIDMISIDAGRTASNKRGSGQDLLAMRDYQPNDDMRRVDWKATARSRHLMVREFFAEDDTKVTVILVTHMPEAERPAMTIKEKFDAERSGRWKSSERFEQAVSLTAALLNGLAERQAELQLVLPGEDEREFGVGNRHLHNCLKRLAIVQPRFSDEIEAGVKSELAEILNEAIDHHVIVFAAAEYYLEDQVSPNVKICSF
jgi:uncharacterized protein (DUF58 family)